MWGTPAAVQVTQLFRQKVPQDFVPGVPAALPYLGIPVSLACRAGDQIQWRCIDHLLPGEALSCSTGR